MSSTQTNSGPQIPQFFEGRSVFITGATGFMGKVLVERLLSTCPDISRLYLLMRAKRNMAPATRLLQLKQSQVFDNIRQNSPEQLDKLVIIPGDVTEPELGISSDSMSLMHEVSIVFHSAATVKFDEELRKSVEQNVRPAMRVLELCDRLPRIEAFVHVSTAYSNAEHALAEERVYPAPVPLPQLLGLVDAAPAHLLNEIQDKYIAPKPNTYTFTKAMAENVVESHDNSKYPIAIFRPSIVICAHQHPFPGWIENMNGPSGVLVAVGKGMLHVFPCDAAAKADMVPVDIAIDTLIAVAWETAVDRPKTLRVYNCCTFDSPTTWGDFELSLFKNLRDHPLDKVFWYPTGMSASNYYKEKCMEILFQTVPLYLAEYISRLLGIKTRLSLITADQRLRAMTKVLKFFSMREFRFETSNVRRLHSRLSPEDAKIYNLDVRSINWESLYLNFVKGIRRYLLKEKDQDMEKAKNHMRKMQLLHYAVSLSSLLIFIRLLLRNDVIRRSLYGALRLLLSLFHSSKTRIVLQKLNSKLL